MHSTTLYTPPLDSVNTTFINGRQQLRFQLSQISGGYLIYFARSAFRFGFFFSTIPRSLALSAFISSYIYIIHQGRQSDFLRVGGPLFATKDGRLCELFECFCVLSDSSGFCVFVFYHWEAV
jgi:hypothetical protein